MSEALLEQLNSEQLRAVTWPAASALILAGAGSGKTRVLTTRIAWLIATQQTSALGILAVTFTNKAAKEMQHRLASQLGGSVYQMWLGTFHGLCNRFLRAHYQEAGLVASFQILDSGDQQSLIKRLLKTLNVDVETCPPKLLANFINHQKENGLRAHACKAYDHKTKELIDLYAEYEKVCAREQVVDFAELLLRCLELFQKNAALLSHYQHTFRFILVDEFQDTNPLQYAWLKLLASGGGTLFAVGDDDQSIYGFRGAEVGNMRALMRDFQVQEPVRLEQNYRSSSTILEAANAVIQSNQGRLGKSLWTDAGAGEPIRFFEGSRDVDEAEFIIDEVKALQKSGETYVNMAILYRSNAQSRLLEQTLIYAGIPYRIYGGLRFYERQEIKHALAYLRLIANPDDDNALLRIINVPARGIGAKSLENLQLASLNLGISLWQAACSGSGKLAQFVLLIEKLRAEVANLSLSDSIMHLIEGSGLRALYEAEKITGEERIENLNELVSAAASFKPETADNALIEFLSNASLESGERQAGIGDDALQLMTIHAAKGLEFNHVFVSGLEEGLFPHENSASDESGLQEERRLMYVAITRARQRLYLSAAQARMLHGQTRYNTASRFINEIPEKLLLNLSTKKAVSHQQFAPVFKTSTINTNPNSPFRIGQALQHPKFGLGTVVKMEGGLDDLRLYINFAEHGLKWLDARYAKLSPA